MFRTSITELQSKLAKVSQPSSQLTAEVAKGTRERKTKLRAILRKLKQGAHIQNRQLKTWLTADEYAEFERMWAEQRELRSELKSKPVSVVKYEALLKRGLFAEAKANGYASSNRRANAQSLADARRHFERAIEFLSEELSSDPSLSQWFDRTVDSSPQNAIALCGAAMPRAVTSRSADKASGGLQLALQRKTDVKIAVIERALERCG
jgi:hypothetical protein